MVRAGSLACLLYRVAVAAALHGFWTSENYPLGRNVDRVLALCKSNRGRVIVPAHGK
jgi:hypothetical protein